MVMDERLENRWLHSRLRKEAKIIWTKGTPTFIQALGLI
jgi:hypothetical protein